MNKVKNMIKKLGKKGEFTLQGMILSALTAFLFIGFVGYMINSLSGSYSIDGYVESDLTKYDQTASISTAVNNAYDDVDGVTVDKSVFDYLGDVWSKIIGPFKFIYRSFTTLIDLTDHVGDDLQLPKIFADYMSAVLTVLVIVGIVMIKFYMGRKK